MKAMIMKWLVPALIDAMLNALVRMANKSSNTVDDALIKAVMDNRQSIIDEMKASI